VGLEALVLLTPVVMLGGLFFGYLVRLERDGRVHVVVLIILGLVVADAFLNGTQRTVPAGLFRPTLGGLDVRLPDLVIPLALAARLVTARSYRPLATRSLVWIAFFAWYGVGMVVGYFFNNPVDIILFQSKLLLWMGGGMIIASRANLGLLVSSQAYVRGVQFVGAVGGLLLVMRIAGIQFAMNLPGVPLPKIGDYSADASTLAVLIGLPMLLLELAREVRRVSVVLPCLALLLMPFGATQGAAFVGLGVSILLVLMVSATPEWRRRVRVRPMEIVLFASAVVGLGLFAGVVSGSQVEITQTFEENIEEALFADVQETTTALRVELWQEAWEEISADPLFAAGVGARVALNLTWPRTPTLSEAHNIYWDVALRLGLIGIGLFLFAFVKTIGSVISVWRRHYDDLVATFVLGLGIALAGLAAKGFAESILEKYRLIVVAGIFIGFVFAAASELDQSSRGFDRRQFEGSSSGHR